MVKVKEGMKEEVEEVARRKVSRGEMSEFFLRGDCAFRKMSKKLV